MLALWVSGAIALAHSITGTWIADYTTPDGRETFRIVLTITQAGANYAAEISTSISEWPRIFTEQVEFDGQQLLIGGGQEREPFFKGDFKFETISGEAHYGDLVLYLTFRREELFPFS